MFRSLVLLPIMGSLAPARAAAIESLPIKFWGKLTPSRLCQMLVVVDLKSDTSELGRHIRDVVHA